jgi:hypothetical protein
MYSIKHLANLRVCVVNNIVDPNEIIFTVLYLMRLWVLVCRLAFGDVVL